jgi:methionyl-tRNA formyltransferase
VAITSLRIVFAGTPEFAAIHLASLIESHHQLLAVYTQPDRPAGRGRKLHASPVKQLALGAGLPVYQPASLKGADEQQALAALDADVLVVVAYGLILPQPVLDAPRLGCLNVHASLLPRWRGAAPIQRAIEYGDTTSGVTIMQMDAGLDTGRMLAEVRCPIDARASASGLHDALAQLGPPALLSVLDDLPRLQQQARTQDESKACYAHKILKSEAQLDWSLSAVALDRKIRAFNPFPICYTLLGGQRIRVWEAKPLASDTTAATPGTILRADSAGIVVSCAEGQLRLEVLQLEGGKALAAGELLRAHEAQFAVGRRFDLRSPDGS